MRTLVSLLMVFAACGSNSSGGKAKTDPTLSNAAKVLALAAVPRVTVATAIVAEPKTPPPVLVIVDAKNELTVNAAASWDELATKNLLAGAKRSSVQLVEPMLVEGVMLGKKPPEILEGFADLTTPSGVNLDLSQSKEDLATRGQDDPPPPEEEDAPDDGDESGGTGTAMVLEEGKMGKKDSDRAEGQYKMQRNQEDPELARRQKELHERLTKREKLHEHGGARGWVQRYTSMHDVTRQAVIAGEVTRDGGFDEYPFGVVLAAPTAKAKAMILAISATRGLVAVAHGDTVRPLRIQFATDRDVSSAEPDHWIELRVSRSGFVIEAVPDAPSTLAGPLDQAALAAALDKARKGRELDPLAPIDVLVEADVDAQRLVDVLVALDQAGVTMIGLGNAPDADSPAAKQRGARRSAVKAMPPNAVGELDKPTLRKHTTARLDAIKACYDKELASKPALRGTVTVLFFIGPDGKVKDARASGVDPKVASCTASVVKAIVFPTFKSGGTQVNYRFRFEP